MAMQPAVNQDVDRTAEDQTVGDQAAEDQSLRMLVWQPHVEITAPTAAAKLQADVKRAAGITVQLAAAHRY
jgi:hypothetical protein